MGRGFLAGAGTQLADLAADDYRHQDPRYADANVVRNQAIVAALRAVACTHAVGVAQVALAWLLAQGPDIVPIPGTKRRVTMCDSAAAADLTLSPEDLAILDNAASRGRTAGRRHAAAMMATTDL